MAGSARVPTCPVLVFAVLFYVLDGSEGQQPWTPDFEAQSNVTWVPVGQSFQVDFFVKNVQAPTTGYQSDILFNPADVQLLTITQGPYLRFGTFFGSTVFVGKARIGGLNFPAPTPLPPGAGRGVLATATFKALRSGVLNFDMAPPTLLVSTNSTSLHGTTRDTAVFAMQTGDILAVSGIPNPGGIIMMEVIAPKYPDHTIISAASYSNTGLPIPGVGTVPLGLDPLLYLALFNIPPYSNSVTNLDRLGYAMTTIKTPSSSWMVGIRLYFASVILNSSNSIVKISNGASLLYITP